MPQHLIDKEGNVYREDIFGRWNRQEGLLGTERDTTWTGSPRIKRDWLGHEEKAQTAWGHQIDSRDGVPLYEPDSSPGGSSSSDALAGLAALGTVILAVLLIGLLIKLIAALIEGWVALMRRYPSQMRVVNLSLGALLVGEAAYAIGFPPHLAVAAGLGVPALWTWLWLTRRLPLLFVPINLILFSAGLWYLGEATRPWWVEPWGRLTVGLPLVGRLSLLLAALPSLLFLWSVGRRHAPAVMAPLSRIVWGGVLWFLLMRVWTAWQPFWVYWASGTAFLSFVGWVVFLLPLALWLWVQGAIRWPLPFTALGLLLFGLLMGHVAGRTQSSWYSVWQHWARGLFFSPFPIAVVTAAPLSLWLWNRGSQRWPRWFLVPNLLLAGGFLWLLTDRTRPLWASAWEAAWGRLPLRPDLPLVVLALPLAFWAYTAASGRWPRIMAPVHAVLAGLILWAFIERSRPWWGPAWLRGLGRAPNAPNPAVVLGLLIPACWAYGALRRLWPWGRPWLRGAAWIALGWWTWRWLLFGSTFLLRALLTLAPLALWGWLALWRRYPRWIWPISIAPWAAIALAAWRDPALLQRLLHEASLWLQGQLH